MTSQVDGFPKCYLCRKEDRDCETLCKDHEDMMNELRIVNNV